MAIMTTQHSSNVGWWFLLKVFSLTWLYHCPNAVAILVSPYTQFGTDIFGEAVGDGFGRSVSISSDESTLVVGAPFNDKGGSVFSGSIRVYQKNQTAVSYLQIGSDIDGEESDDSFGFSVSISADGSTLVVGAPFRSSNTSGQFSGSVYVYTFNPNDKGYTQSGYIDGKAANELFGSSVSISADGSTFVVGALTFGAAGRARVYILNQSNSSYTQFGPDLVGENAFDQFGYSVRISSDASTLIVGAPRNVVENRESSGSVSVYKINQEEKLYALWSRFDGEAEYNQFGRAVSVSADGSTFVVGAPSSKGVVRVYKLNQAKTNYTQFGLDIVGEVDEVFGWSLSISGDGFIFIVGTLINVRVFALNEAGSSYAEIGSALMGNAPDDEFGDSVSISGDGSTFVVGAPDSGSVRVFHIPPPITQYGPVIYGEAFEDAFGWSVSISADGSTLIVGAPYLFSFNGSGSVYVYQRNQTAGRYVQIGSEIDGEEVDDSFGVSVSVSADGSTFVAGAPNNGINGSNAGSVRVYTRNPIGGGYTQFGSDIDGKKADEFFGRSVSISRDGSTFVVATRTANSTVSVYSLNESRSNYTQIVSDLVGEVVADEFLGYRVCISADGSTIIVGAPSFFGTSGSVRVYKKDQVGNTYKQSLVINGTDTAFGSSVRVSEDGSTFVVGAPGDTPFVSVYRFNQTENIYMQFGSPFDGERGDISGDGSTLIIAAPAIATLTPGTVTVYKLNQNRSSFELFGFIQEFLAGFGSSVSISGNGLTFAVTAEPPTKLPTKAPTKLPTKTPTKAPTKLPTKTPTKLPTKAPTKAPTKSPSKTPTKNPTKRPTMAPTKFPTKMPTKAPTKLPTKAPTKAPTKVPTKRPTKAPTKAPTTVPTKHPTKAPTKAPTKVPTKRPTKAPTKAPTKVPTKRPTKAPTKAPLQVPLPVVVAPITAPVPVNTPIAAPLKTPVSVPVVAPTPINIPIKASTKPPTKIPSTRPVTVSPTTTTPVASPTNNCGLFGFNLFCPRPGECGFFRRLFNINGC